MYKLCFQKKLACHVKCERKPKSMWWYAKKKKMKCLIENNTEHLFVWASADKDFGISNSVVVCARSLKFWYILSISGFYKYNSLGQLPHNHRICELVSNTKELHCYILGRFGSLAGDGCNNEREFAKIRSNLRSLNSYGNIPDAFRAVCRPPIGASDHNVVHSLPKYKAQQVRSVTEEIEIWNEVMKMKQNVFY